MYKLEEIVSEGSMNRYTRIVLGSSAIKTRGKEVTLSEREITKH